MLQRHAPAQRLDKGDEDLLHYLQCKCVSIPSSFKKIQRGRQGELTEGLEERLTVSGSFCAC